MKLFCFPYAGSSSAAYMKWKKKIREGIEIVPVELPGRGAAFRENLCDNMTELIEELFHKMKEDLVQEEYMLYGHSMGSWIVYYLLNRILKEQIRLPERIFVSGKEAPYVRKMDEISYSMEDGEFLEKIYQLGGTPREIMDNKEILDIYVPILKNDYKLIQTCKYEEPIEKYNFDIIIFNGLQDELMENDLNSWKQYTDKGVYIYNFEGNHFFIHNHTQEILDIISEISLDKRIPSTGTDNTA